MRIYLGGIFKAIGSIFTGDSGGGGNTYITNSPSPLPSADDSLAREKAAADEASRREQAALNQRQGARASLYTDPTLEQTFSSNPVARKTLLGTA